MPNPQKRLKELELQSELALSGYLPSNVVLFEGDAWAKEKLGKDVYALRSLTSTSKATELTLTTGIHMSKKIYRELSEITNGGTSKYKGLLVGKVKGKLFNCTGIEDMPASELTDELAKQTFFNKIFPKKTKSSFDTLNEWVSTFNNSKSGTIIGFFRSKPIKKRFGLMDFKEFRLIKQYNNLREPARLQLLCRRSGFPKHLSKLPMLPAAYYQNDVGEFEEVPIFLKLK